MRTLANNLVRSVVLSDNIDSVEEGEIIDDDEDYQLNREFSSIGKHQSDIVKNMIKGIKKKLDFHRANSLSKWDTQKDILDYQALKEIRSKFHGLGVGQEEVE